ncbi:MAG: hypothetical protein GXO60_01060 [Epsilonproteobacteria bacterium]|nr:hypothetical protein [Campylobacterota bacterium]
MKKRLEVIKDTIKNSDKLSDEQKSSSFKLIEEWIAEDKAFGTLYEKLLEVSEEIEPILIELGLV